MVKKEISLWVDDVRDPVDHGFTGWTWAKSFDQAVQYFIHYKVIEASLDHDLGQLSAMGIATHNEKTGYDLVCWMEEHNIYPMYGCYIHSQNPVGAQKMRVVLDRILEKKLKELKLTNGKI